MAETQFKFAPSPYVPFRDVEAIARCRAIKRADIARHRNADLNIRVIKDADVGFIGVTDMVARIKHARDAGQRLVMILPNPAPMQRHWRGSAAGSVLRASPRWWWRSSARTTLQASGYVRCPASSRCGAQRARRVPVSPGSWQDER